MKTAEETWNKLRELEDIFDQYLGFPCEKDDWLVDHWCDRFERLKKKILESYAKQHAIEFAKYIDEIWFTAPFEDNEYKKTYKEWINTKRK